MNDPKNPNQEPRRTSQPQQPGNEPPMEAPTSPATEFEKNVPHPGANQPVAKAGESGEGSYKGTEQYTEGYKKFAQQTSPDEALKKAKQIDPNDPKLREANEKGKAKASDVERASSPSLA